MHSHFETNWGALGGTEQFPLMVAFGWNVESNQRQAWEDERGSTCPNVAQWSGSGRNDVAILQTSIALCNSWAWNMRCTEWMLDQCWQFRGNLYPTLLCAGQRHELRLSVWGHFPHHHWTLSRHMTDRSFVAFSLMPSANCSPTQQLRPRCSKSAGGRWSGRVWRV